MQASKTEQGEVRFDCLSCHTAIVERPVDASAERAQKS
jgi:hypothetical protein